MVVELGEEYSEVNQDIPEFDTAPNGGGVNPLLLIFILVVVAALGYIGIRAYRSRQWYSRVFGGEI